MKQSSKEYNWKYVWANSNEVYFKENERGELLKIQTIKDTHIQGMM